MATKLCSPQNTPQNKLYLRKEFQHYNSIVYCYKKSNNPNSLACGEYLNFEIHPYFINLPASWPYDPLVLGIWVQFFLTRKVNDV